MGCIARLSISSSVSLCGAEFPHAVLCQHMASDMAAVCCRSGVFGPAAAANYRSNLLRTGNLPDRVLRRIDTPTLLLSSAKDRMLPSLAEGMHKLGACN